MLGEREKKLVNHEPAASGFQAFRVISFYPKWVNYAGKPMENASNCFYKTPASSSKEFHEKLWILMQ